MSWCWVSLCRISLCQVLWQPSVVKCQWKTITYQPLPSPICLRGPSNVWKTCNGQIWVHYTHIIRLLGDFLAPSSHCSILIETPWLTKPTGKMTWAYLQCVRLTHNLISSDTTVMCRNNHYHFYHLNCVTFFTNHLAIHGHMKIIQIYNY
jgi:hypothetical protein